MLDLPPDRVSWQLSAVNAVVRNPLGIAARQFEDMALKGAFTTVGRVICAEG